MFLFLEIRKKVIRFKWYVMVVFDIILYFWVKLIEMYEVIKVWVNFDKIVI